MFLVFEGADGCGKTTAISYINEKVNAHCPCKILNDWCGDKGLEIKSEFVSNPNLTDSDRVKIVNFCRAGALQQVLSELPKSHVLYDRFILSTYAYQSTLGIGTLPVFEVAQSINISLKDLPYAPLFVMINGGDYATQQSRINNRDKVKDVFDSLPSERYNKLQSFFNVSARKVLTLHYKNAKIVTVNNTGSLDDFHAQLDAIVDIILNSEGENYES